MASHRVQQWLTFARQWWIYDARWQCPFKMSSVICHYLQGRHKPIYHSASDVGDHVVIINTKHIAMKEDLWRKWKHFHHTGYPGGFSATPVYQVHDVDPTKVMHKQIYATLPGTLLRRPMMARLHLYPEEDVPPEILKNVTGHIRQVMPVAKALNEYTKEEIEQYPRLFEWPEDYVVDPGAKKKFTVS